MRLIKCWNIKTKLESRKDVFQISCQTKEMEVILDIFHLKTYSRLYWFTLQALEPLNIGVATGEACQNRVMFKQFLMSGGVQFCQVRYCLLILPGWLFSSVQSAAQFSRLFSSIGCSVQFNRLFNSVRQAFSPVR